MDYIKSSCGRLPKIQKPSTSAKAGFLSMLAIPLILSGCGSQSSTSSNSNGFAMVSAAPAANANSQNSAVLSQLKISDSSVSGGASTAITLTLGQPAPAGGVKVQLTSSELEAVQVPSTAEIAEGRSSIQIPIPTSSVAAATSVGLRAQVGQSIAGANLTVLPPATAPFSVSVLPSTVTVQQGKSGSATATTKVNSGFNHALSLKASGEPTGASVTFKPQTIPAPGSGTSKMTMHVASDVQTGSYPLTVTASEGSSSASAKTTLKVISGTGNPNATFKGCWYKSGGHRYQAVDLSIGNPGTYPFNAILYHGTTCNPNDFADQIGFGDLIDFGGFGWTFWFTAFGDQANMSALWYVGDQSSQCVSYASAPNC